MKPVLFELLGFPVNSYGVSKALAAIVAALLLAREFRGRGWDASKAWDLVIYSTVVGFVGGKLYFLAENLDNFELHHLGGSGFTWYGCFLAGDGTYGRPTDLPWALAVVAVRRGSTGCAGPEQVGGLSCPEGRQRRRGLEASGGRIVSDAVTDPVCGMQISPGDAVAEETHDGQTFFFCGEGCHRAFLADPHRYGHPEH